MLGFIPVTAGMLLEQLFPLRYRTLHFFIVVLLQCLGLFVTAVELEIFYFLSICRSFLIPFVDDWSAYYNA